MKLFSVQLRNAIIFSVAIALPSNVLMGTEVSGEKKFNLFESIATHLRELGHEISQDFHEMLGLVEDVFHIPHGVKSKFNYDVTLVGFVNFADGIGRHPILFKQCLEKNVAMNFLSTRNIPARNRRCTTWSSTSRSCE